MTQNANSDQARGHPFRQFICVNICFHSISFLRRSVCPNFYPNT